MFWWAGKSEDHLRRAVDELVHGGTMPFAVLTPTRAHLSLRIEALLKREGCVAVALADLVALGDGGVLTLKGSPDAVRRQDEPEFVKALGNFRVGRVWGDCARLLQARVRSNPPATMPRLFTHNVPVDKWNEFQLSGLPGDDTVLESAQTGPDHQRAFLTKNLLTPATLRLKPGALVMFTVNKSEPGRKEPLFVNGQIGSVEAVEPGAVVVRCKNGEPIRVERFTWRYDAELSSPMRRAGQKGVGECCRAEPSQSPEF